LRADLIEACLRLADSPRDVALCNDVTKRIPSKKLPKFLLAIAKFASPLLASQSIFMELEACIASEDSWPAAEELFHRIRVKYLASTDESERCILSLLERSAKLLFNLTNPPAPFDKTAGDWFMVNLCDFLELRGSQDQLQDVIFKACEATFGREGGA
jgi:hypothetical protein